MICALKNYWELFLQKKSGQYLTPEKFLKKNIFFENKKNTNVITIEYKAKDPQLAYNVVNSIINNYIVLHKEINTEKAKSDKDLIEKEYNQAKVNLNKKMQTVNGLPATALVGVGNLAAMSAYSKSAQNAIANLKEKYIAGEKFQIEVKENAETVSQLASKLEWAKLVDEISDSSKVILLKEPQKLKDFEYSSPNLIINIILGIIFGIIGSFFAIILNEFFSKKLSYTMIGNNIIYNLNKDFNKFKSIIFKKENKKLAFIFFDSITSELVAKLQEFQGVQILQADISKEFANKIHNFDSVIFFEKINETDSEQYKLIKDIVIDAKKEIIAEVLI